MKPGDPSAALAFVRNQQKLVQTREGLKKLKARRVRRRAADARVASKRRASGAILQKSNALKKGGLLPPPPVPVR